ncbi:RNA-binding protein cp33, partial [Striga asiatica]
SFSTKGINPFLTLKEPYPELYHSSSFSQFKNPQSIELLNTSELSTVAKMAASSLSVAIGTCSQSFSVSTSIDRPLSLHLSPYYSANPKKGLPKLKILLSHSPFFPISRLSISRASSAFDGVGLDVDEDEETESEVGESASEEEFNLSESADGGRLYVGNLLFTMTAAQLEEIFSEAGKVISVEIVYDRVTDRSRGFAFITMGTVDEAKEAIRLFDGAQIGGRVAKVNFPEVPRGGEREVMSPKKGSGYQGFVDSPHKIYAGNLSWNLTSQGLREAFAEQPGFLSAKIIFDRESGRSRGFGFVTFSSAEELESALNVMNDVVVEGRPLRLKVAEPKAALSTLPSVEKMSENNLESSEVFSGATM